LNHSIKAGKHGPTDFHDDSTAICHGDSPPIVFFYQGASELRVVVEQADVINLWSTLVRRHNDPVHDFCVIGLQNKAAFDVWAYEHVIIVDAHSRLPRHQSRLGVSAQRGCHWQAVSEER
jgi:hypothetical protein